MPIIKSAKKQMRSSAKAQQRNKVLKLRISSLRRNVFRAIESKDAPKSKDIFAKYCSALDKAAKKGVIKKNTAIRRKRRASARLASCL